MFYKFNGATGRVELAARESAYNPQGFSKPVSISAEQRAYATASASHSGAVDSLTFKHNDVRVKQHSALGNPHIPTYLRGARDPIIFRGLMLVTVVCAAGCLAATVGMVLGKNKK